MKSCCHDRASAILGVDQGLNGCGNPMTAPQGVGRTGSAAARAGVAGEHEQADKQATALAHPTRLARGRPPPRGPLGEVSVLSHVFQDCAMVQICGRAPPWSSRFSSGILARAARRNTSSTSRRYASAGTRLTTWSWRATSSRAGTASSASTRPGTYYFDLGSTNGTCLDGKRLQKNTAIPILQTTRFTIWMFELDRHPASRAP